MADFIITQQNNKYFSVSQVDIIEHYYGASNIATFINAIKNYSSGLLKSVHIGDSLVAGIYWAIQSMITNYAGYTGGGGFVSFVNTNAQKTINYDSLHVNVTSEWTEIDSAVAADAEERGINMESIVTSDSNAICNAEFTLLASTSITVWYYQKPGGGTFDYYIDTFDTEVTIDTDGVEGLKSVTSTGLTDATHKINIRNIQGGEVRIFGVQFHREPGLQASYLANGGSKTEQWASSNLLGGYLSDESPDFVSILLGANDSNDKTQSTYKDELKTMIDQIKANTSAGIFLMTPNDRNPDGSPGYVDKIRRFAAAAIELVDEEDVAFFDLNAYWYTYAEATALGLLTDDIHPNAAGWLDQGTKIYNALMTN